MAKWLRSDLYGTKTIAAVMDLRQTSFSAKRKGNRRFVSPIGDEAVRFINASSAMLRESPSTVPSATGRDRYRYFATKRDNDGSWCHDRYLSSNEWCRPRSRARTQARKRLASPSAANPPPELSAPQPHRTALPTPSPTTSAEAGRSRQAAGARRAARRRLRPRAALNHASP